jgi:hypothetical protein
MFVATSISTLDLDLSLGVGAFDLCRIFLSVELRRVNLAPATPKPAANKLPPAIRRFFLMLSSFTKKLAVKLVAPATALTADTLYIT